MHQQLISSCAVCNIHSRHMVKRRNANLDRFILHSFGLVKGNSFICIYTFKKLSLSLLEKKKMKFNVFKNTKWTEPSDFLFILVVAPVSTYCQLITVLLHLLPTYYSITLLLLHYLTTTPLLLYIRRAATVPHFGSSWLVFALFCKELLRLQKICEQL